MWRGCAWITANSETIHWKDVDPDVPILKEAKAEYAKLK
jgi:C-terminal processing protease CtpA/Prc